MKTHSAPSNKIPAITGLVMVIPTTFFLISVLLKYGAGYDFLFDLLKPYYTNKIIGMLIFFLPFAAMLINIIYVLALKVKAGESSVKFDIEIKLKPLNIGISLAGLIYTAILFSYLVTENLGHYYRGQM
jgi:hypothetical protein